MAVVYLRVLGWLMIFMATLSISTQVVEAQTSQVINVPGDVSTIQGGINMAGDGDIVLVAPGVYQENLVLSGKTITLASQYYTTGDPDYIKNTIVDGDGSTVIRVMNSVGSETSIIGLTIQNGSNGVIGGGVFNFLHNRVLENGDGIDYESGGGGICNYNLFEGNTDDGIDLDGAVAVTIENNTIASNDNDGIEIRLHPYRGTTLDIAIRRNLIHSNGEDGIQLIDYPDLSDRVFHIERNLIRHNAMAGVGLMGDGNTAENYEGASIPERIHLFNNTFVGNDHGWTGGDNLIAINNIFADSTNIAIKNADEDSIVSYSLFWGNGIDIQNSNVDQGTKIEAEPAFDSQYHLLPDSPAIDAGTAFFSWNGETVLNMPPHTYAALAPDLGAFEYGTGFGQTVYLPLIMK